jgi:hypothetical protein
LLAPPVASISPALAAGRDHVLDEHTRLKKILVDIDKVGYIG